MRKKQKRNELEKPFFYALCMPCDQITTPLRGGMRRLHALCTLHTTRDDEIRTANCALVTATVQRVP